MAILSPGPSSFNLGALRIWRFDFDLPHASHCTVVMPMIFTPSDCCTRCSIAEGPGWPRRLCHSIAVALCDRRLARFIRTWKAAAGSAGLPTTHWPCCSDRVAMIDPSHCRRLVGSSLFSHHMPCLLSRLNDIRLQRKSGHHATLSKRRVCSPCVPLVVTRTFPYPRIQTLVFPAQI